jgi:glycosyltransferase involved in cell wall biosynthesis
VPRPTPSIALPAPATDAPLRFGVIGADPLKGVSVAVEAFRLLPQDTPAHLLVFGPVKGEPSAKVTVHPSYRPDQVEEVFASFDILIVPSLWWENAILVLHEAFARGKPVIASDLAGMSEAVRDGVDGYVFPPGDVQALADKVRYLATRPATVASLQAAIEPPPFVDEYAKQMVAIYAQAMQSRNPATL